MTELEQQPAPTPPKMRPYHWSIRWVREIVAIALWGAVFVHLFAFDVAQVGLSRAPRFEWLFRFRLLALLAAVAVSWLLLGNQRFIRIVGYILGYPFVVVAWHAPRLMFKNWATLIAFSPALYSLFSSFRIVAAFSIAALIGAFLICLSPQPAWVVGGVAIEFAYLLYHFYRRLRVAFSSSTVFADVSGAIRKMWSNAQGWAIAKPPEGLSPESDSYREKVDQNLLWLYAITTGLFLVGERLRDVINSKRLDLYFLGSLLYTFALTTVVFALGYYGLERLQPGSFVGIAEPKLVDFLGLSFCTMMTSEVSPLRAGTGVAQTGMYLQLFGSLLIIVLLVFVILTSIRERYRQDMDDLVRELGAASESIGGVLEANYELTVSSVEALLLKANQPIVKWLMGQKYGPRIEGPEKPPATPREGSL